jgi:hypothetical protein
MKNFIVSFMFGLQCSAYLFPPRFPIINVFKSNNQKYLSTIKKMSNNDNNNNNITSSLVPLDYNNFQNYKQTSSSNNVGIIPTGPENLPNSNLNNNNNNNDPMEKISKLLNNARFIINFLKFIFVNEKS